MHICTCRDAKWALGQNGRALTPKMMSDDDSPSKCCDRQVKIFTPMHSIGPSEIVLMSSMYLLQWTYVGWGVEGNALFHVSGLTLNSYDTLTYSTQKREQFFIIFLSNGNWIGLCKTENRWSW
jgi:hypothetical protein